MVSVIWHWVTQAADVINFMFPDGILHVDNL